MATPTTKPDITAATMKVVEATNAGDLDMFASCFTDDVVFYNPDGTFEGKQAVMEWVADGWSGFHPTYVEDSVTVFPGEDPHKAAVAWTLQGTFTAPITGVPATGKTAVYSGVNIATINDEGLFTEINMHYNVYDLWQQIGLVPQRGGAAFKAIVMAEVAAGKTKDAAGKAKDAMHL